MLINIILKRIILSWYHNRFLANDDNEYGDYLGWIGTMGCYAQCNMRIGQAGFVSTLHTFALFVSLARTHWSRVYFLENSLPFQTLCLTELSIWLMIYAKNLGVNPSYHYVELHSFNMQYCSISNLPLPLLTLQFGLDVSFRIFHQLQFPEFTQESNVTATAQFSITHKVKSTKLASEMTRWINVVALTRLLFS